MTTWEPRNELFTLERLGESEVQQKTSVTKRSDAGTRAPRREALNVSPVGTRGGLWALRLLSLHPKPDMLFISLQHL